jgi:hypothetical protein
MIGPRRCQNLIGGLVLIRRIRRSEFAHTPYPMNSQCAVSDGTAG